MLKGTKASLETRNKQSLAKIGKKRPPFSLETRQKMSSISKNRVISEERKLKQSQTMKSRYRSGEIIPKNKRFFDPIEAKKHKNWMKNKRNRALRILIKNGDTHSYGEWELLKKQYNFTCPACRKSEPEIKLTADHIVPVSRGGSDSIENIQPLCKSCNCRKHTKIIRFKI